MKKSLFTAILFLIATTAFSESFKLFDINGKLSLDRQIECFMEEYNVAFDQNEETTEDIIVKKIDTTPLKLYLYSCRVFELDVIYHNGNAIGVMYMLKTNDTALKYQAAFNFFYEYNAELNYKVNGKIIKYYAATENEEVVVWCSEEENANNVIMLSIVKN